MKKKPARKSAATVTGRMSWASIAEAAERYRVQRLDLEGERKRILGIDAHAALFVAAMVVRGASVDQVKDLLANPLNFKTAAYINKPPEAEAQEALIAARAVELEAQARADLAVQSSKEAAQRRSASDPDYAEVKIAARIVGHTDEQLRFAAAMWQTEQHGSALFMEFDTGKREPIDPRDIVEQIVDCARHLSTVYSEPSG